MIYTKDCPKGIDIWIQNLQKELYSYVLDQWCLSDKDYDCYGRVYRNRANKQYKPEAFAGNKDYNEVFLNDKVSVLSFFGMGNNIVVNDYKSKTADVHVVFFVNLDKVYAGTQHRADSEVREDIFHFLREEIYQFIVKSEVLGVDRVLEEYPGLKEQEQIFFDQHPWHCFRFNMQCTYDPNTK